MSDLKSPSQVDPGTPQKVKRNFDIYDGYKLKIVSGNANPKLATEISEYLQIPLEDAEVSQFADKEINIHISHNVRGSDIYIIQPTCTDVNKNLMELLLLIHTLKLSSAKRITAIMPYFGYARQDRKVKPRVPISASAVAQLIEAMGPSRVVCLPLIYKYKKKSQQYFSQISKKKIIEKHIKK